MMKLILLMSVLFAFHSSFAGSRCLVHNATDAIYSDLCDNRFDDQRTDGAINSVIRGYLRSYRCDGSPSRINRMIKNCKRSEKRRVINYLYKQNPGSV